MIITDIDTNEENCCFQPYTPNKTFGWVLVESLRAEQAQALYPDPHI